MVYIELGGLKVPADLHVHTRASDGSLTPEQVVLRAVALGLRAIAITDHDTVMGVARALRSGRKWGLHVIPGVELSTEAGGEEFHILGYFINYRHSKLRHTLAQLRRARFVRIKKMTRRINELGLRVSWPRVLEIAGRGAVGRPHLARAMVEGGYISSVDEAFTRYIGSGRPAYVPRLKYTPIQAIKLIQALGGVPVLAHPGWIREEVVIRLAAAGLRGLEVYYPQHNARTSRRLYRLAQRHNLLITGGSDFHGDNRRGIELGSAFVTSEYVTALKEASPSWSMRRKGL